MSRSIILKHRQLSFRFCLDYRCFRCNKLLVGNNEFWGLEGVFPIGVCPTCCKWLYPERADC